VRDSARSAALSHSNAPCAARGAELLSKSACSDPHGIVGRAIESPHVVGFVATECRSDVRRGPCALCADARRRTVRAKLARIGSLGDRDSSQDVRRGLRCASRAAQDATNMDQPESPSDTSAAASSALARRPPPKPYDLDEVLAALRNPLRLFDLVLSAPDRLAASLESERAGLELACAFVLAGTAFATPFGLVIGWTSWWRIAALYMGSTAICLPSLFVFARYVGVRVGPLQITVLASTIPAVAALFTFGFAPVLAFLRATMAAEDSSITWLDMSRVLLVLALIAGVARLWRCLVGARALDSRGSLVLVLLGWHAVCLHVVYQMSDLLGLRG